MRAMNCVVSMRSSSSHLAGPRQCHGPEAHHRHMRVCRWPSCSGSHSGGNVGRAIFLPRAASTDSKPTSTADANPEDLIGASFDPHGLFPPPTSASGGHFARRMRERGAASSTAAASSVQDPAAGPFANPQLGNVRPIPAHLLQAGGIPGTERGLYDHEALQAALAQRNMPVDLAYPGLRILHLDPFICSIDAFCDEAECQELMQAVLATGQLQTSRVGAGNVQSTTTTIINHRRTSSSLLLDAGLEAAHPRLAGCVQRLRASSWKLLCADGGAGWGRPGQMPQHLQYVYESLQVARYEQGQYFLSHEDAFPIRQAAANGFQRHATVLLYLNSVASCGATRFDHLGLSVQPQAGKALLFFPAMADGSPDPRTLHTAMDAQDTKWVAQQWVSRGYADLLAGAAPPAVAGRVPVDALQAAVGTATAAAPKAGQQSRQKGKQQKRSKGFGG